MDYARGCKDDHNVTVEERVSCEEIRALFELPLPDLVFRAQVVHRQHWDPCEIQVSRLVSIKTGACPEDCRYCAQSSRYETDVGYQPLMDLVEVLDQAKRARAEGSTRLCMGAAWREIKDGPQFDRVIEMVRGVKELGLETCVTLGMLQPHQAERLREAGLDYYNHNLDTSPEYYGNIITTRTFQDRLQTLHAVRSAGIRVCSGGILGLGESRDDRVSLLRELANLPQPPDSVPINRLMRIPGTPLVDAEPLDDVELVRSVAVARILLPGARIRLSAGRVEMSASTQFLCFLSGANSIFSGEKLLTADNPGDDTDETMLRSFGMRRALGPDAVARAHHA